jgi:RNA polymerase sigma-70 factor (ECF subfamily)
VDDREALLELIPAPRPEMSPAPEPADAELILAVVQRDDRAAFAMLVRRHQSRVRALLRRLTRGDDALADDLAQETFVLVWRNLPKFRFEARFSTWLHRIAVNAWQSEARKKREVSMALDGDAALAVDPLHEEMPDVASRIDLERALATLNDGERAAIAACYHADLSHEEAAQALGIPLGTVKTHVLRAKAKLKVLLAAKEKP